MATSRAEPCKEISNNQKSKVMGKIDVTNGDWSVTEPKTKNGSFYRVSGPSEKVCNVVTRDMVRALNNAKIIADAGTTYNKSGLTASELLEYKERFELLETGVKEMEHVLKHTQQQRDELLALCKRLRKEARSLFAHCIDQDFIDVEEGRSDGVDDMENVLRDSAELIQKIENHV